MSHLNNLSKLQLITKVLYLENQARNERRYLADTILGMTTLERAELLHALQDAGVCTNCAQIRKGPTCWDCADDNL